MKSQSTSKTYRLTTKQLDLIADTKKKPPYPTTDSEALRIICDRASGAPEPVRLIAGLAPSENLQNFHRLVAAVIRSIQNLRSAIAGNLDPSAYDDPVMQQVVKQLRQQAEVLPDELRKIRDQTLRMAELLGLGLTSEELKGIRKLQKFYMRVISKKDDELKQLCAEKRLKLEAGFAETAAALALLDRLFGPAVTVQSYGHS